MAQTEGGTVRVKVVPDVSGMEPAIRAELARIAGKLAEHKPFKGEVSLDDLTDALIAASRGAATQQEMARSLMQKFVILRRESTSADES